ncbi:MAG: DUF503 domain-containing protein [Anaerolineales bacterium]|nr:DUF503 domain-containing protein [Anaerolineales bacterium]
MHITACVLELGVPGSKSLKEKRGRIQPLMAKLKSQFGLAAAEIARQDSRDLATVGCVAVSTDPGHNDRVLRSALHWIETHRPDLEIRDTHFEPR